MTSVPALMPNQALPPLTKIEVTNMMIVMRALVVKPRFMVACMFTFSLSMASLSASSKRPRSKSSRPQVLTARMFVTASERMPERRFCAWEAAEESGRILRYIV